MTTPAITSQVSEPLSAERKKTFDRINKTAQEFESVFIAEMLKPMVNMVEVNPDFGGGRGEEVFRDFTTNEYAKKLTSQGGIGIANHVREQLIHMQAANEHPGARPDRLALAIKDMMAEAKKVDRLN